MPAPLGQRDQLGTPPNASLISNDIEVLSSMSRRTISETEEIHPAASSEDNWETDPSNARNWSTRRKWTAAMIVSMYTFLTPFASTLMAPGLPALTYKYHIISPTISAMTLSIFLLSNAFAPLILAPMSEMYGRTWVLHLGNLFSMIFHLGCAFAPNVEALITFRFLAGLSGGAPFACGAGSIGDLFSEHDRASAMAIYSLGPLLGPIMGPIIGGLMTERVDVKYLFILLAGMFFYFACFRDISEIDAQLETDFSNSNFDKSTWILPPTGLCGAGAVVGFPLLKETYGPVLRYRKALKMGDVEKALAPSCETPGGRSNLLSVVWLNLKRPAILLCRSFICFILSLYMAFMYGITFMMFTTFGGLFADTYGFKPSVAGLAYLGLGIGFIIAAIIGAKFSNKIYAHLAAKNCGKGKPEMRMPALFFGSFFIPIGLLWYGWSAQAKLHWIMPIIGSGIFGFGTMTNILPIQLYLVDTFTYAASAVAASMVFRSLLGFSFPLFGQQMYNRLGLGYSNTLLALLGVVLGIPFPVWIYYYGESIRARSPLTRSM